MRTDWYSHVQTPLDTCLDDLPEQNTVRYWRVTKTSEQHATGLADIWNHYEVEVVPARD
jgi:hypothetical protein